jgi:hypothetical protein
MELVVLLYPKTRAGSTPREDRRRLPGLEVWRGDNLAEAVDCARELVLEFQAVAVVVELASGRTVQVFTGEESVDAVQRNGRDAEPGPLIAIPRERVGERPFAPPPPPADRKPVAGQAMTDPTQINRYIRQVGRPRGIVAYGILANGERLSVEHTKTVAGQLVARATSTGRWVPIIRVEVNEP